MGPSTPAAQTSTCGGPKRTVMRWHRGEHLFIIAHVGAQAHTDAAAMFNLELGQVELGLRAGEKPDAGSGLGEAERERLPMPRPAPVMRTHLSFRSRTGKSRTKRPCSG